MHWYSAIKHDFNNHNNYKSGLRLRNPLAGMNLFSVELFRFLLRLHRRTPHVLFLVHNHETLAFVERVGVARGENAGKPLDALVRMHRGDQRFAQTLPAESLVDDHVREPVYGRIVRHAARKADLFARAIHAETKGVLDGFLDGFEVSFCCPIGLLQHFKHSLGLNQRFVVADHKFFRIHFHSSLVLAVDLSAVCRAPVGLIAELCDVIDDLLIVLRVFLVFEIVVHTLDEMAVEIALLAEAHQRAPG